MLKAIRTAALASVLLAAGQVWSAPADVAIAARLAEAQASGAVVGARLAAPEGLARFYDMRGNAPAWFGRPSADELFSALTEALDQGFRPPDFHTGLLYELHDKAKGGNAEDIAAFDIMASDAAVRLVHHMVYGKVNPEKLDPAWNFVRPVIERDPAEALNEYLDGAGFGALMERLAIADFQYLQLVDALARYREIEAQGGWGEVPEGGPLKPDMEDPRVPALRARLAVEGDYTPDGTFGNTYDAPLVTAVSRFQLRHGLTADGVIGPKTLASLNRPVSDRIAKIRLSLERFRWYSRGLGDDFVLVNIAGARTFVVLDGQLAWATRSITGSEYRQTPVFRDNIQYMEFNPTWTVPASIFRKDKLARIRKDPGYLDRNDYIVRNSAGKQISASSVNWSASNPGVTLMQKPGAKNALGLVKFMFPNDYAVYLHDTSNRELFDQDERNLSSGCVRIEDPFVFAGLLMRDDSSWTQERMQAILDSGKTTRVDLPKPLPVLLTYWTAWVEDDHVQFREDPYERDGAVLKALDANP